MNDRNSFHNPFKRPWIIISGAALSRESFIPPGFVKAILAGSMAGCFETTITFPADYVKTRLQLDLESPTPSYKGIADVVKKTVRTHGFKGLYRGFNVSLYGTIPEVAVRFGTFEYLKDKNMDENGNLPAWKRLLFGMAAGTCEAVFVSTPFDSIQVKLIHDHHSTNPKFTGYFFQGVRQIVKDSRGIRGLYQGLFPTILKQASQRGITFFVMETLKDWYTGGYPNQSIKRIYIAIFGIISGAVTVTANTPFDVIKTRMQGLDSEKYKNTFNCAYSIAKHEGFFGFYKGYVLRLIVVCLENAITFAVYYSIKEHLEKICKND